MPSEFQRAKAIFLEAVAKTAPAEQAAFLAQACAGDHELRERVDVLLRAHDASCSVLNQPAAEQFCTAAEPLRALPAAYSPAAAAEEGLRRGAGNGVLALLEASARPGSLGRLAHYEVLEVLGQGGFGTVFKGFDDKLHRMVAIKVLAPALAANGTARQRFMREARAAAAVRDEHVIDIHAVDDNPSPYLVMEFIDGRTLQQKLDIAGAMPVKEILRIGYQTAAGLSAAHKQGLIHRDIKPSNILLENGVERVKLSDFGLARAVDDASLSQSGLIAGTPLYMSPEQAEGKHVDKRSDLFSLGCVLYTLCTGHPPFRAGNTLAVLKRVCEEEPRPIREINPEVPDWLAATVGRLLAKKPAERFGSAPEAADVLARYLSDLQLHGQVLPASLPRSTGSADENRTEVTKPSSTAFRSRRHLMSLAIGAVGFIVLGIVLALRRPGPATPQERQEKQNAVAEAKAGNPLDRLTGQDIPPPLLALAAGGDGARAPADLVAVLGEARFALSGQPIGTLAVSRDGQFLAASCGEHVILSDAISGRFIRLFTAASAKQPGVLDFSTDGKLLLATSDDNTAWVWETASGVLMQTLRGQQQSMVTAIFGHDGKAVITGGAEEGGGAAQVWDVATGKQVKTLPHPQIVRSLALNGDGTVLVTGCQDHAVRVWDLAGGDLKQALPGHTAAVEALAFSADGKHLASGGRELKIWDGGTFRALHTLPAASDWIGFGSEGTTILAAAAGHGDDEAYVVTRWDMATGKPLPDLKLNHQGGRGVYALSPDGKTLFAARQAPTPDHFACAYDIESGKEKFPAHAGHTGQVWSVAFSPDGSLLASGGSDKTVRLWDLADWRKGEPLPPVHTLGGHAQWVWSVRFSPDGKVLASGGLDRTIVLWDVERRKKVRTLTGHSGSFARIAFSPDGQTIAGGQTGGTIKLWNVASGKLALVLAGHEGVVRCVAFSPDGKLIASSGVDKTVQVRALEDEQVVQTFRLPNIVDNVAFSADGKFLAATTDQSNPSTFNVWEVATWKNSTYLSHNSHAPGLAWCPTASLAATSGYDKTVRFWDLRDSPPRQRMVGPGPFGSLAGEIAFAPDGRYWAIANQNGTIAILKDPLPPPAIDSEPVPKLMDARVLAASKSAADALDPKEIPADLLAQAGADAGGDAPPGLVAILGGSDGHVGQVAAVDITANGALLVSAGIDKSVKLWDLAAGKLKKSFTAQEALLSVSCSPDGGLIAAGGYYSGVRIWNTAADAELHFLPDHGEQVRQVAFSPDGKTLATTGFDGLVRLWDPMAGKLVRTFVAGSKCWCLAFSADSKTLAVGLDTGAVSLWDVATGWSKATLAGQATVRALAFHPDGRTLAVGTDKPDHTIHLWDLTTLREKARLTGHTLGAVGCAWRADGGLLASWGVSDGAVRLWELGAGPPRSKVLQLFTPEVRWLHGLAFTPEGRYLATANPNGTIYVLKLADAGTVFHVDAD